VIDRRIEQSMSIEKMRIVRWFNELIIKYRIRSGYVRGSISVAFIVDKMRENRLRWFGRKTKGNKCSESCYENEH
jgi:hypothetical protein